MSTPHPLPDFDGKYQAARLLASHPRTRTFAAECARDRFPVFIKMLHESLRGDAAAVRAFHHEPAMLRLLARNAPAEVAPHLREVGEWQGCPYFVQPLLRGWGLAEGMLLPYYIAALNIEHAFNEYEASEKQVGLCRREPGKSRSAQPDLPHPSRPRRNYPWCRSCD